MVLLIDDLRTVKEADTVARSAKRAKQLLKDYKGKITEVYFDHDLGCKLTGYDVLVWALKNDLMPPKVTLISSNWVGRTNMANALVANGYTDVGVKLREKYQLTNKK